MPFVTDTTDGAVLLLRVIPRANKTAVQGLHGDALKVRLNAPPVEGAANTALVQFLAKQLKLPRSRVQLLAGETSRNKRVLLIGCNAAAIRLQLAPPPAAD